MKFLIITIVAITWPTVYAQFPAFEAFKTKYNKRYGTATENLLRATIFTDNQNFINSHNRRYTAGLVTYDLAMNKFGDLLPTEFALTNPGYKINPLYPPRKNFTFFTTASPAPPNSVDWRALGAVTPVKNEQRCSASYAFAAAGALEGQIFRKLAQLPVLSEQNLIDCTKSANYFNRECSGGTIYAAFQYARDNNGIAKASNYPNEQKSGACRFTPNSRVVGVDIVGYIDIWPGNESDLKFAVADIGPVAAAIDGSRRSFQFYKSGVYNDLQCTPIFLNRAVLITGYGMNAAGQPFWTIKNSLGSDWGTDGFMQLARNNFNQCGIATSASYPIVRKSLALGSNSSFSMELNSMLAE